MRLFALLMVVCLGDSGLERRRLRQLAGVVPTAPRVPHRWKRYLARRQLQLQLDSPHLRLARTAL